MEPFGHVPSISVYIFASAIRIARAMFAMCMRAYVVAFATPFPARLRQGEHDHGEPSVSCAVRVVRCIRSPLVGFISLTCVAAHAIA
jgi:hypothetical protein